MSGAPTDLLQIAQVLKSNGTEGEIILGFRDFGPEDIDLQEPVFIYFDGLPVPFFIESIAAKGPMKALVRLTGMKNLEDAEEVAGSDVFALRSSVEDLLYDDEELDATMLVGWELFSEDGSRVGEISDFEPIPGNPCLYVEAEEGTVMVPLHDDLILDIDEEGKKISLRIPEGLI